MYHLLVATPVPGHPVKTALVHEDILGDVDDLKDFFLAGTVESVEYKGRFEIEAVDQESDRNTISLGDCYIESD
jgi:hypothetical protein